MDISQTVTLTLRGGRAKKNKVKREEHMLDNNINEIDTNNTKKKKSKAEKRYAAWERYIQDESLAENWERFLHDLGLGDFKSKTQCKKKLHGVWVNIPDFLSAVNARNAAADRMKDERQRAAALAMPVEVRFFATQRALSAYTIDENKIFPRGRISKDSPLKLLLADILKNHR